MSALDGIEEVNVWPWWQTRPAAPATPQAADREDQRTVLLVDRAGRPLIVREPRPVGFRRRP